MFFNVRIMEIEDQLNQIFKSNIVYDEHGVEHTLSSNIDINEGHFITDIINKYNFNNTIEIGCAMGISSLFICSALKSKSNKHHTIIDPMQSSDWANIGKNNLEKAGVDFFEIIEQPSEIVLPKLLENKKQYDFGFIDGWHTFDHTLIDFFYLNRLIKIGGVIVIDDISFPAIKKLMRYIINYPAYEYIGGVELKANKSLKRYIYEKVIPYFFRCISKFLPHKMRHKVFTDNVLNPTVNLKLNTSMIAIRKIQDDSRRWDWFVDF